MNPLPGRKSNRCSREAQRRKNRKRKDKKKMLRMAAETNLNLNPEESDSQKSEKEDEEVIIDLNDDDDAIFAAQFQSWPIECSFDVPRRFLHLTELNLFLE